MWNTLPFQLLIHQAVLQTCAAPHLDVLPERQRVVDLCHLVEVLVVGDAQRLHAVHVAPLFEVALKRAPAPVAAAEQKANSGGA
jgi:hypothetical protein